LGAGPRHVGRTCWLGGIRLRSAGGHRSPLRWRSQCDCLRRVGGRLALAVRPLRRVGRRAKGSGIAGDRSAGPRLRNEAAGRLIPMPRRIQTQ
jgi:hypothetical protein